MKPEPITEAWQAMSLLSDAQEMLFVDGNLRPVPGPRKLLVNDFINHAKRHLQRFIEMAQKEDPEAFLQAVRVMGCTLENSGEEEVEEVPEEATATTQDGRPLHTLEEALEYAKQLALNDVYGMVDPFTAVEWRKTLPAAWQPQVEAAIVEVYHTT